jgi:predicted flap endonuclease-1-like 5' DNA nuclease
MLKKEQLRQELHRNLQQIAQLQHNDSLLYEEYQKLKGRYEREYEKKLQELNKSKQ